LKFEFFGNCTRETEWEFGFWRSEILTEIEHHKSLSIKHLRGMVFFNASIWISMVVLRGEVIVLTRRESNCEHPFVPSNAAAADFR